MTVKIKNDDLFDAYLNAEDKANKTFEESLFGDIRLRGRQELVDDMGKVRDAFLNHEKVEWENPKFRIRILRMSGSNGHQYVSSTDDNRWFACGSMNSGVVFGHVKQEFTRSDFSNGEWEYFKGNPEVFKFEEVEE